MGFRRCHCQTEVWGFFPTPLKNKDPDKTFIQQLNTQDQ